SKYITITCDSFYNLFEIMAFILFHQENVFPARPLQRLENNLIFLLIQKLYNIVIIAGNYRFWSDFLREIFQIKFVICFNKLIWIINNQGSLTLDQACKL